MAGSSVDDPIAKHLDGVPESWRAITLRHFLTHTSGVMREGPAFDPLKVQPDRVVIRSAFALPLEFPTGSKYQYCNVCYFALAEIIARVSGKPWDAFLERARVCVRRGCRPRARRRPQPSCPDARAGTCGRTSDTRTPRSSLALRPSGAFLSTVRDLARWDAALYQERVLTQASREAMWTPARLIGGAVVRLRLRVAARFPRRTSDGCTTAGRFPGSEPRWRASPTTA